MTMPELAGIRITRQILAQVDEGEQPKSWKPLQHLS